MEDAADCWGRPYNEVFGVLCKQIIKSVFGEIGFEVTKAVINGCYDSSNQNTYDKLVAHGIIDGNDVRFDNVIFQLYFQICVSYAKDFAVIPMDRALISLIIEKVLTSPFLNADKISSQILLKNPGANKSRIDFLVNSLIDRGVLVQTDGVEFNKSMFFYTIAVQTIKDEYQYMDSRVVKLISALLSLNNTFDDFEFNPETIDCGLSAEEIDGVLSILSSNTIKLVDGNRVTIMNAMKLIRIRYVARLLAEIGYPEAKRVINYLIKYPNTEYKCLLESLVLDIEKGTIALKKLEFLGVLEQSRLGSAFHTSLVEPYTVWTIKYDTAIENSSSYLLGFISYLLNLIESKDIEEGKLRSTPESELLKTELDRLKVIAEEREAASKSLLDATRKFLIIHELQPLQV